VSSTLSSDTKDALAHEIPQTPHCRRALRDGLLLYGTNEQTGVFSTQRLAVARLARALFFEVPAATATERPIRKVQTRLARAAAYEIAVPDPPAELKRPAARCDRRMELRAAFLACGSLSEPQRGYHLEFVPPAPSAALRLTLLLRAEGRAPKAAVRKGRTVVYFKGIDEIALVLSAIGAFNAVLHLEDVRALKETKNRIHRLVNTEAANVDRAAGAAAQQREHITFLEDAYGLRNLSPVLREAAQLRLIHPTDSLAELGRRCSPPVGKSTLNTRLAALTRLATSLRTTIRK
jgi:DNA-binding transcriptional regulator WhiA